MFRLFCHLAEQLDVEISTLPWELCDENICAPAFATNWIQNVTRKSASLSKHDDYNTERGIPFAIPKLYGRDDDVHDATFQNGSCGKPWLVEILSKVVDLEILWYPMKAINFCFKQLLSQPPLHP